METAPWPLVSRVMRASALLAALLWVQPACTFDDGALESLRCGAGKSCSGGAVCCQGFCLPDAGCKVPDLVPWPDQPVVDLDPNRDTDGDQVPDALDCAPTNAWLKKTALSLKTFAAPAPFSPVEPGNDWEAVQGVYVQNTAAGMHRSALPGALVTDALATAKIRFLAAGDDGLTQPAQNLSLAGVVLRTGALAPAQGTGYYCAVDLASGRLQLGMTASGDLAQGKLTLFADPVADGGAGSTPGKAISGGVVLKLPFIVSLELRGGQLTCQAVQPNQSTMTELSAQDSQLASGGVALFTAGASAQFETASLCVP